MGKGKRPKFALTPHFVQRAPAGLHADGLGLYLLVDPTGSRRWILKLMIAGRRHELGLGSVRIVSLADARTEALRLKRIAYHGGDPLAERRKARTAGLTFAELVKRVHKSISQTFRNEKHASQWLRSLEVYANPHIGSRPVGQIVTADVMRVLVPIWHVKPETAHRVRGRIEVVLDVAAAEGARDENMVNPAVSVLKGLPTVRRSKQHHRALPYRAIPAFIESLKAVRAHPSVRLCLEFLTLTAVRTNEAVGARWDEFDLKRSLWTIPAGRMKANAEHRVPLSRQAIAVLELARSLGGETFVFPGTKRQRLAEQSLLQCIKRMKADTTTHGLRSAFRDFCAERTTFPREVAEAALAHTVRNATERAYLRTDHLDQRRALMNTWGIFCVTKQAEVVSINAG